MVAVDLNDLGASGPIESTTGDDRIRLLLLIGAVVSFGLIGGLSGLVVVSS